MTYRKLRVIVSGGGTGGHIFPAISIADKLRELNPETEILFVGAEGRMEMEKVPAAGYRIVGLPVAGLQRKLTPANILSNLKLPFKVLESLRRAGRIIREFKPDLVIGVGGYASAPLLWKATSMKIPSLIQEQNSFAGLTNRTLAKKVDCICTAYEGMERFFPASKTVLSGNPIRSGIHPASPSERLEAMEFYGFDPSKKHLLVIGGSLGSGTLNEAMKGWIRRGRPLGEDVEVLWQCGRHYIKGVDEFMAGCPSGSTQGIIHTDFIARMDLAYAAADVVISRSGASSISELCVARKACIFVPSPNVAEDHQRHNAMALVSKGAALMVSDADAGSQLLDTAMELIHSSEKIASIEEHIAPLGMPDAALTIAVQAYRIA